MIDPVFRAGRRLGFALYGFYKVDNRKHLRDIDLRCFGLILSMDFDPTAAPTVYLYQSLFKYKRHMSAIRHAVAADGDIGQHAVGKPDAHHAVDVHRAILVVREREHRLRLRLDAP